MITVAILINGRPLYARSARNISGSVDVQNAEYLLDSGKKIRHYRPDGAVALAKLMLEDIKEP